MGIQRVPDAVAQEVKGHNHQGNGNAGNQRQVGRGGQHRKTVMPRFCSS